MKSVSMVKKKKRIYSKIASISESVSHELSLPELSESSDESESSSFRFLSLLFVSSVLWRRLMPCGFNSTSSLSVRKENWF